MTRDQAEHQRQPRGDGVDAVAVDLRDAGQLHVATAGPGTPCSRSSCVSDASENSGAALRPSGRRCRRPTPVAADRRPDRPACRRTFPVGADTDVTSDTFDSSAA